MPLLVAVKILVVRPVFVVVVVVVVCPGRRLFFFYRIIRRRLRIELATSSGLPLRFGIHCTRRLGSLWKIYMLGKRLGRRNVYDAQSKYVYDQQ